MPWCPQCKYEYENDKTMCADCRVQLVDVISEPAFQYAEPKLLATVSSRFEADNLEAYLKSDNIPVMRKEIGSGMHLTLVFGTSYTGTELYVPEHLFLRAAEAVGRFLLPEYDDDASPGEIENEPDVPLKRTGSRFIRRLFICALVPIIIGLIYGLIQLLQILFQQ